MTGADYVGRFAPSPTGPLHFGSLVAALASYVDARAHGGRWLVRIEDIDPPREVSGAGAAILRTLDRLGLQWDGEVLYQSTRIEAYRAAAVSLLASGIAFRCRCTRRTLDELGARVYPGRCHDARVTADEPHSLRVRVGSDILRFDDLVQGAVRFDLARDIGDFVIWRRDGLCAYQLAVTVDDQAQGVTHVIRGTDLLDSTPRQILLRQLLGYALPAFGHIPVAVDATQQKLSKQTGATDVAAWRPSDALYAALEFLQQKPPAELARAAPVEQLEWAMNHWELSQLQGTHAIEVDKNAAVVCRHPHNGATQHA